MTRLAVLSALLLATASGAATISGTACPGAGCSLSYVADAPALAVQVSGTWTGSITVEVSNDAVTFFSTRAYSVGGTAYTSTLTENGAWTVLTGGLAYVRVRATAWTYGTATVMTRPAGAFVPADIVRAVGPTNGPVLVSGTVTSDPSPTFLAALSPALIYPALPPAPTLTTTVTTLDDPSVTGRIELTVRNLANGNLQLWCCRGATCTPTATAAYILNAGDTFRFEGIRDSDTIRCRAATDPVKINYVEVAQ